MPVTIVDIARKLKLSHATVSRVLNKREDRFISEATRDRVLQTSQEMGYRPNPSARALVTGRTGRIVFWMPDLRAQFFQEMSYRFHRLLRKVQYEMIAGEFGPYMTEPEKTVGLTRMDVDGAIVWGGGLGYLKPFMESIFSSNAPVVNIGSCYDGTLDFVQIDIYSPAREAMQHLLGLGRDRIAYMGSSEMQTNHYGRYRAYNEILTQAGKLPEYITLPDGLRASGRLRVKEYVREHGRPGGIFCANDEVALGAYRGLRDLGLRVPEDVALVGCDGIEELEYIDAPISTIAQPMEEICESAWRLLFRRMEKPGIRRQVNKIKAKFIVRK